MFAYRSLLLGRANMLWGPDPKSRAWAHEYEHGSQKENTLLSIPRSLKTVPYTGKWPSNAIRSFHSLNPLVGKKNNTEIDQTISNIIFNNNKTYPRSNLWQAIMATDIHHRQVIL